jgi:hypothetical protein
MSTEPRPDPTTVGPPAGLPPIRLVEPTGAYVAGACNIGPAEIARRRQTGWLGSLGAVALGLALVAVGAPPAVRLAVGAPLYVAAIGFSQARERFCVGFAAAGVTNFEALGTVHRIEDGLARAADRRRAASLILRSAAVAVVGAVAFALLPG